MYAHPVELLKFLFLKPTSANLRISHMFLSWWFNGDAKKLHVDAKLVEFSHMDLSHECVIHDSNPL